MTNKEKLQEAYDTESVVSITDKALLFAIPKSAVRVYYCGAISCIVGPQGVEPKNDGRGAYWPSPCRSVAYSTVKDVVCGHRIWLSRIPWWLSGHRSGCVKLKRSGV